MGSGRTEHQQMYCVPNGPIPDVGRSTDGGDCQELGAVLFVVTPESYGASMFTMLKVLFILLKHAKEIPTDDELRKAGFEPMRAESRFPYPSPYVLRMGSHRHHHRH